MLIIDLVFDNIIETVLLIKMRRRRQTELLRSFAFFSEKTLIIGIGGFNVVYYLRHVLNAIFQKIQTNIQTYLKKIGRKKSINN